MRRLTVSGLVIALVGLAPAAEARPHADKPGIQRQAAVPALSVRRQVRHLKIPWDVQQLPGKRLLITERSTPRLLLWRHGRLRKVTFPRRHVWVAGETGLMSLAVDPEFSGNRRIYTCQGHRAHGHHDIRVIAWRLNKRWTRVKRVRTLLTGLPTTAGRHGGCRLLIARNGALLVGTGDAMTGTNPRNLNSLGGKVLRLDRDTGRPWPDNPWANAANHHRRYVLTFGHRNVQGLAERADGTLWSVEHGSYRDDEVNRLAAGGDYGWNPVPGYNESVPMTDQSLPGTQIAARWRSGRPTIATSGAAWVKGARWGALNGTLAVAALKGSRLVFIRFDEAGRLVSTRSPAITHRFGRLRSVTRARNGDLLVTTSNGTRDAVLRVAPR